MEKLSAKSLQIGDWVLYKGKPIKIIGIDDFQKIIFYYNEEDYTEYPIDASNIEPIPLTIEILEKNGYSYSEKRDAWESIPITSFGICKDEDDNCFYFCLGIFDAFNRHSDVTYHYITEVEYVHQLQQALKLCGIEENITL